MTGNTNPIFLAYIGLMVTMAGWGLVPVFLKKLLGVLTPTEVSFSRFFLSGFMLLVWLGLRKREELYRIFREDLKLVLLCTGFGPLTAMVFFNYGILNVTIGTAAVFAGIEPVFTYILAVLLGQEVWKTKRMLSILFALAGIALVILSRNTWGAAFWVSLILVSITPMIWAANNIITKELIGRYSPIVIVSASFVLSSLFLIPTLTGDYLVKILHMGLNLWLALCYCIIIGTIFGFTIWYWCLRHLAASTVAVSMYAIPVFSVTAGIVFLNEPMSWMKGSGTFIVLVGLYLVNVRYK